MAKKKESFKISQSFMKDMRDFQQEKMCGLVFESKWVKKNYPNESTESQKLGQFYEYCIGRALPKGGNVPTPQFTKTSGIQSARYEDGYDLKALELVKKDMLAPYRKAMENAQATLAYFDTMGFEIISAGDRRTKDDQEGTIDLDVRCKKNLRFSDGNRLAKGEEIIIDLKYSGLIGKRWELLGWPLNADEWSAEHKRRNGYQAKQYHYITGKRFFFWVQNAAGSQTENIGDVAFFEITGLTKETMDDHLAEGKMMLGVFEEMKQIEFSALPSFKRCNDCKLKEICTEKITFPEPIQINLRS